MMPPNLTSSADTPRSVAPPFPPAGAGTATGAAGVAAEGTPAEDLAAGDALLPPAAGLEAPADAAGWVPAPDAPLTADGAWLGAGAEAVAAPADDGAAVALSAAGADACGPSGAAAAGWDRPGEFGAALLVFPLSEPPPHAVRTMAAAAAR